MPIIGSRGGGSVKGFGLTAGAAPIDVDYLVVAGGGAGGKKRLSGGGGAGGFRTSFPGGTKISLQANKPTPITIGAGGTGQGPTGPTSIEPSESGNPSIISTITSAGGGAGAGENIAGPVRSGASGGSGGGGTSQSVDCVVSAGNTPPTSPPQGNPGANAGPLGGPENHLGGGGGAAAAGNPGGGNSSGGNGSPNIIYDSPTVGTPGPAPGKIGRAHV